MHSSRDMNRDGGDGVVGNLKYADTICICEASSYTFDLISAVIIAVRDTRRLI